MRNSLEILYQAWLKLEWHMLLNQPISWLLRANVIIHTKVLSCYSWVHTTGCVSSLDYHIHHELMFIVNCFKMTWMDPFPKLNMGPWTLGFNPISVSPSVIIACKQPYGQGQNMGQNVSSFYPLQLCANPAFQHFTNVWWVKVVNCMMLKVRAGYLHHI